MEHPQRVVIGTSCPYLTFLVEARSHMPHSFRVREIPGYRYIDEGPSTDQPAVVLLHGMLGAYTNWEATIRELAARQYRVIVPILPIYDLPLYETTVTGLVEHVHGFIDAMGLEGVVLVGNSLGGHIALLYSIQHPEDVVAQVLCGASGIYEVEMGTSVFRRRDREELRERAAFTFYDPRFATNELVDEIYEIVNDRSRALRLIRMARAVQAESVADDLGGISAKTLLVWGREDRITPPDVAEVLHSGIPDARLEFIDACGHAPMMEQPTVFNRHTIEFLREVVGEPALSRAS